ncbi:MAG: GtrA family protein [Eubacteriales bacterium]|nr:GtrA family protein [Eubacteriales bacterium]
MLQTLWNKLKKLVTKELLLYVLFGAITTLLGIGTFQLFHAAAGMHYAVANVLSWVLAVTFAYITNRRFVFQSKAYEKKAVLREVALFFGARLLSLGLEELGLYLLIDRFLVLPFIAKVIMSAVVIMANYVFSKLVVFKTQDTHQK